MIDDDSTGWFSFEILANNYLKMPQHLGGGGPKSHLDALVRAFWLGDFATASTTSTAEMVDPTEHRRSVLEIERFDRADCLGTLRLMGWCPVDVNPDDPEQAYQQLADLTLSAYEWCREARKLYQHIYIHRDEAVAVCERRGWQIVPDTPMDVASKVSGRHESASEDTAPQDVKIDDTDDPIKVRIKAVLDYAVTLQGQAKSPLATNEIVRRIIKGGGVSGEFEGYRRTSIRNIINGTSVAAKKREFFGLSNWAISSNPTEQDSDYKLLT